MNTALILSPKKITDCLGKSRNPIKKMYMEYIVSLFNNKFTNEDSNETIVQFVKDKNIKHVFIMVLFNKELNNLLLNICNLYYISYDPHNMIKSNLGAYKQVFTIGDNIFLKYIYPSVYYNTSVLKWFVNENDFKININQNVLSFGMSGPLYPMREIILKNQKKIHPSLVYPNWGDKIIGDELYKLINANRITIISAAQYPYNYMNYKYLEVFMCKSLCFCTYVPALDDYGYIPYVHYIPIDNVYYDIIRNQRSNLNLITLNKLITYYLDSKNEQKVNDIIMNAYNHTLNLFKKEKVLKECTESITKFII